MLLNVRLTVIQQMTRTSLQKISMYACNEVELDCHNETLMLKSVVTDSTTQCHLHEVTPVLYLIIIYKTYTICVIYDNEWLLRGQIMGVTNKLSTTDPYYKIIWPWYSLSQWAYTPWRLFQEHVVRTKLDIYIFITNRISMSRFISSLKKIYLKERKQS